VSPKDNGLALAVNAKDRGRLHLGSMHSGSACERDCGGLVRAQFDRANRYIDMKITEE
jgi:hypothetical protein